MKNYHLLDTRSKEVKVRLTKGSYDFTKLGGFKGVYSSISIENGSVVKGLDYSIVHPSVNEPGPSELNPIGLPVAYDFDVVFNNCKIYSGREGTGFGRSFMGLDVRNCEFNNCEFDINQLYFESCVVNDSRISTKPKSGYGYFKTKDSKVQNTEVFGHYSYFNLKDSSMTDCAGALEIDNLYFNNVNLHNSNMQLDIDSVSNYNKVVNSKNIKYRVNEVNCKVLKRDALSFSSQTF